MKRVEIDAYGCFSWLDDEICGMKQCPECKEKVDMTVTIYNDSPAECPKCNSKFIISQSTVCYKLVEGEKTDDQFL